MASRKQAVLIIHGIGNQQPMQTARSFVKAVWSDDDSLHHDFAGTEVWSKPDHVSDSFELRCLTTPQNRAGIRTDFYELYWAHLMHGTGYGHLFGWLKGLLWRRPSTVPRALRLAYGLLWAILGLVLAIWLGYAWRQAFAPSAPATGGRAFLLSVGATLLALVLVPLIGFLLKDIVGDAARYLRPAAKNIQRRQEIRTAGVQVLNALHERDYERIVVVGHSLGAVVGYDILTHAFAERHVPAHVYQELDEARAALEAMAQRASDGAPLDVAAYRRAQAAYLAELEAAQTPDEGEAAAADGDANDDADDGVAADDHAAALRDARPRWRVTDFVTLGSPLTYADVLLARDAQDLAVKIASRECPTCPPALEQKLRTTDAANRRFTFGPWRDPATGKKLRLPHHAAVFAATRWTNLYFPARWLVFGDPIGGPVSPLLGAGIRDLPVGTAARGGLLSHTVYWRETGWRPGPGDARREAVAALREALDLAWDGDDAGHDADGVGPGDDDQGDDRAGGADERADDAAGDGPAA